MPEKECTKYPHRSSYCLRPVVVCWRCKGTGRPVFGAPPCWACKGTGGDRCKKHQRKEASE